MFGAGPVFDELLDRLHDMGAPPPVCGRVNGRHEVYVECVLPVGPTEQIAVTFDAAAQAIIDFSLTCADKDRDAAIAWLEREFARPT